MKQGDGMMQMTMTELNLSALAYDRSLKVSRTTMDLTGSEQVQADHVAGMLLAGEGWQHGHPAALVPLIALRLLALNGELVLSYEGGRVQG